MNRRSSHWISGLLAVLVVGLFVTLATAWDDDRGRGKRSATTQWWATNHPPASRFTTAFPGAMLDKNTGLVWEQAPSTPAGGLGVTIFIATSYCASKNVGGAYGWRLPSVVELKSVQDPSLPPPFVPAGVFSVVQSTYWTSTRVSAQNVRWSVNFHTGEAAWSMTTATSEYNVWCVRGAMQADTY